jgi:hypothetical protein
MDARLLFSAIFLTKVIAFAVLAIMSFIAGVLIQRERMKAFVREFERPDTIEGRDLRVRGPLNAPK